MVAKRFKIRLAIIYVLLSVVVRYVGQAQRDAWQQFCMLRGNPLQVLNAHLVDKLLHGALHAHRVIRYALWVKAVFAAQRTTNHI